MGCLRTQVIHLHDDFETPQVELDLPIIMPPKLTVYHASMLVVVSVLFQQVVVVV